MKILQTYGRQTEGRRKTGDQKSSLAFGSGELKKNQMNAPFGIYKLCSTILEVVMLAFAKYMHDYAGDSSTASLEKKAH